MQNEKEKVQIGNIISKLRRASGYTQEEICRGICSISEFDKIELNLRIPGYFELDRFFSRMGKSTESLEYILSKETYELYELRYCIQKSICQREFEKAMKLLRKYQKKKYADRPLHCQYIEQELAQIYWMTHESLEKVQECLNKAIQQTLREKDILSMEAAIGIEELQLLLFQIEISLQKENEKCVSLKKILIYIERHITDINEKVKVYPYAVILLVEYSNIELEYSYLMYILETALELFRDTGGILYLSETIQKYIGLLQRNRGREEKIERFRKMRNILRKVEGDCGIYLEKYRLFQSYNREFELDYELLRRTRIALKMSQEEVCEGICEQETLSRIENGKRKPHRKTIQELLERVDQKRNLVETVIMTEDYEVLELKQTYENWKIRNDKEKIQEISGLLRKNINYDEATEKYIIKMKVVEAYEEGKLSAEVAIDKLLELVPKAFFDKKFIQQCKLTATEANILNEIALLYQRLSQYEKADEIYKKVLRYYEGESIRFVFHAQQWKIHLLNYAKNLEQMGKLKEVTDISRELIAKMLETGKTVGVEKSMELIEHAQIDFEKAI